MSSTKRTDAPTKGTFRTRKWQGNVINPVEGNHYVFANSEESTHGNVDYYEDIGYEVVRAGAPDDKNATRVHLGSRVAKGQPLKFQGLVLVTCEAERYAEIQEFGPDGMSGRNLAKQLQQKVMKDALEKKLNSRYIDVVSSTTPLIRQG